MRITGSGSGMDIDKLVTDLMTAEKQPLIKLQQDRTKLEWKRDAYRDVNKTFKDLDDLIFNGINKQAETMKKVATSTDQSIVTVNSSATAQDVSNTIKVNQLATSTTWVSNNTTALNKDFSSFVGQTITLNVTNGDGTIPDPDGNGIPGDPVKITIETGDTLDKILSKLNKNKSLGVSAFYDSANDKVVLSKVDTGSQAKINIADSTTTNIFKQLGFIDAFSGGELGEVDSDGDGIADDTNSDGNTLNENNVKTIGKNANFELNGYQTTRASNTFTINDITYTLHSADTTKTVGVQSAPDTDSVFNTIKAFVDKYNDVIKSLNDKMQEKTNRDYLPLTDDQKKDMKDTEITLWEQKAKSGLLRSDSVINNALSSMRLGLYSPVSGLTSGADVLSKIGITTSSVYQENGKLEINEDKLKAAIKDNPQQIYDLFNKDGSTFDTKGIARRLRDTIKSAITQIEDKAGNEFRMPNQYVIGKQMNDYDDRISKFNDKLTTIEDRYYKQFNAMDNAMSKYNSQYATLFGAASGGSGN